MNRIVIAGASAGGLATAEALRRLGYQGVITLVGDEDCLPYDRPPLSKQILTGEWDVARLVLRRAQDLDELGVDLRLGDAATNLDPVARTVTLADGSCLAYDSIVVATGAQPRRLPGSDGVAGVYTLRTKADALALKARLLPRRRLVIVGAGFVGAEVACAARGLGVQVTLLEAGPVPLALAVGEQAGRLLSQSHHDHGVDLRTGVSVSRIHSAQGKVTGVELTDGSVIVADDVLVAIGSVPNTAWLDGSGLTIRDGLVCDQFSAAAPGVYGVGDVARWYNPLFATEMRIEHRTNAAEQGMAVARNLLNPDSRSPFAPVPYFWSEQYGMKIQSYGYLRDHDEAVVVDGEVSKRRFVIGYRRGDRLAGVLGVAVSPKVLRQWRALIAAGGSWEPAVTADATA